MKRLLSLLLIAATVCLVSVSQELPQFKPSSIEGWVYNNPGVVLTPSNVSNGSITLYVNSQGKVLTLTSPEFSCQDIDSIAASVIWYIKPTSMSQPGFSLPKTALTMAIDDAEDHPLDSVTYVPELMVSDQTPVMTLAVPKGLSRAKLRFVAWKADKDNCGAVKRALFTAVAASQPHGEVIAGDVNGDGKVGMDDLSDLINYLLVGHVEGIVLQAADVDCSGAIGMDDLSALINILLTGA